MLKHSKPISSAIIKITLGFEAVFGGAWQAVRDKEMTAAPKKMILKRFFIEFDFSLI